MRLVSKALVCGGQISWVLHSLTKKEIMTCEAKKENHKLFIVVKSLYNRMLFNRKNVCLFFDPGKKRHFGTLPVIFLSNICYISSGLFTKSSKSLWWKKTLRKTLLNIYWYRMIKSWRWCFVIWDDLSIPTAKQITNGFPKRNKLNNDRIWFNHHT